MAGARQFDGWLRALQFAILCAHWPQPPSEPGSAGVDPTLALDELVECL
jgi:hypothetical protein